MWQRVIRNAAPDSSMDFLFFNLLQWGASQGFKGFNFGTAPLAGIQAGVSASLWKGMKLTGRRRYDNM